LTQRSNLVVGSKSYNDMINASIALVKSIKEKQHDDAATITQEEADFANAFICYTNEILDVIENNK
jgi:hypothetical protein